MYNKNFNKGISLVVAIMLWIYVVGQINPSTERTIERVPIKYTNEYKINDEGLSLNNVKQEYVDVTIKGKRSEVNSVTQSDIKATGDLKSAKKGTNSIAISVKTSKNVEIKEFSPETVTVEVEDRITESKPVQIKYQGEFPKNKEPGETYISPKNVQVSGSVSRVKSVSAVRAYVDVDKIKKNGERIETKLTPVDKFGKKVSLVGLSSEKVVVVAKMMETKKVNLKVRTVGEVGGSLQLDKIRVPDKIKIKGDTDTVKRIKEISADAINLSNITETTTIPLNLNLPYGVSLADESEDLEAKVILKKKSNGELSFDSSDITINGLTRGYGVSVKQIEITAKVTGKDKVLENLDKGKIHLYINLYGLKEGTHKVKINENHDLDVDSISFSPKEIKVTVRKE